ncbi:MAG: AMMECR1 domain-containing protein, partial [Bacillota bacterium]|nr:AMMECR1 domain-containing protein [Bacillota bacterium]
IKAAYNDPRFEPVEEEELAELTYSVDVLGELEAIKSEAQLDPNQYGVVVEAGPKKGLLLPALPGVDTVQQQLDIAKQKAGIKPGEEVSLYRFKVVRYR